MTELSTEQEAVIETPDAGAASPESSADALPATSTEDDSGYEAVNAEFRANQSEDEPQGEPEADAGKTEGEAAADPEGKADSEGEAASETSGESEPPADEPKASKFFLTEDEIKALPEKAQKRIEELTAQRHEALRADEKWAAAREVSEDPAEVTRLAKQHAAVEQFTSTHNLQPTEVADGYRVMAMIKGGHAEQFLQTIKPWLDWAQQATGQSLAPRYQTMVDNGEMTEDAAREAQRAAVAATEAQARADTAERAREQDQQTQQAQNAQQAIIDAGVAELQSIAATDADFAVKRDKILTAIKEHTDNWGSPADVDRARLLVQQIHQRVTSDLTPTPKPAVDPGPAPQSSGTRTVSPAPTTELEELNAQFRQFQGR